jgi:predicted nucleic acid-binding protein
VAESVPQAELYLSIITIPEIEIGILRIERLAPARAARLRIWMDNYIRPSFVDRILLVDMEVALCCARLHVPDRRPMHDALIAATAQVHELTLVTRNIADFSQLNVAVFNPWE